MEFDAVSRVLQEAPFLSSAKANNLLAQVLHGLDLSHLSQDEQFRFLDKIADTVDMVSSNTRAAQWTGANAGADTLQLAYVRLLKNAIDGSVKNQIGFTKNAGVIVALTRAIYHLQQIQISAYRLYRNVPEAWWEILNQLYSTAQMQQLLKAPCAGNTMNGSLSGSIDDFFKQCFLIALADPGRLSLDDLETLIAFSKKWATLVDVHVPCQPEDQFILDLTQRSAPIRRGQYREHQNPRGDWRSISMNRVIPELAELSKLLKSIPEQSLDLDDHIITKTFLSRLTNSWGERPARRFHRLEQAGQVHLSFQITSDDSRREEVAWDIVNTSPDGYCLVRNSVEHGEVIAGGLVRLKDPQSKKPKEWQVGVLRWVNHSGDGMLRVGVQLLSPEVKAVSVKCGQTQKQSIALLLPPIDKLREAATLVVPNAIATVGAILSIESDQRAYQVQLRSPIEHHLRYKQFAFQAVD